MRLSFQDIEDKKEILLSRDIVILQMEIPGEIVSFVIDLASKAGKKIVLNYAPAVELDNDTLRRIDYLILNEIEAASLAELENGTFDETVRRIREKFPGKIILTLGNMGCILVDGNRNVKKVSAFQVEAVDSTGCNDAFVGGFVCGLLTEMGIEATLEFASAAGALAVIGIGAQPSLPYKSEVEEFLYKQTKFRR